MAVNNNPYSSWQNLRDNSDYRSTETQFAALTRQQLSQSEYLLRSNRVNPGPDAYRRRLAANSAQQLPLPVGSQDMWGWQSWAEDSVFNSPASDLASGLKEQVSMDDIPGANYSGIEGEVGGAST